jgi:hypothetical protein
MARQYRLTGGLQLYPREALLQTFLADNGVETLWSELSDMAGKRLSRRQPLIPTEALLGEWTPFVDGRVAPQIGGRSYASTGAPTKLGARHWRGHH